ncbi:MAG: hypothetical protein BGO77_05420 [Caedibacter sp. 37-49]|nr:MAG: hypothetical protein BGO77_05420 [Caedibacter sp. 37-49]
MKKTLILWSFYIFSLMLVSALQAGNGNPWDPRGKFTDERDAVTEENGAHAQSDEEENSNKNAEVE